MDKGTSLLIAIAVIGFALYTDATTPLLQCGNPGLCPYIHRVSPYSQDHQYGGYSGYSGASLCGNLCNQDSQCRSHEKCCPTNCGYICREAVYVIES